MATTGALERLRAGNQRARHRRCWPSEGPMSRADLARGTGLSRTTVSSLVADLIAAVTSSETADRGRPHKGGSGRPPLLVALSAPGRRRRRRRHRPRARPGGGRRPDRRVFRPRTTRSSTSTRTAPTCSTGPPRWSAALLADAGLAADRPARRRHVRARSPGPALVADPDRHPAGLARPAPERRAASGASASRSSPTTTPTSVRSPSSTTASPAVVTTSSTSRWPAGSGPASCSAAGCTAARPGSPARSATSRSARTVRSAGAATAAASRPSWPRPGCWRCCSRRTTRTLTVERRPRARRATVTPAYGGCSPTPGAPSVAPWPTCANSLNPEARRRRRLARRRAVAARRAPGARSTATPSPTPPPRSRSSPGELGDRAEVVGAVALAIATVVAGLSHPASQLVEQPGRAHRGRADRLDGGLEQPVGGDDRDDGRRARRRSGPPR